MQFSTTRICDWRQPDKKTSTLERILWSSDFDQTHSLHVYLIKINTLWSFQKKQKNISERTSQNPFKNLIGHNHIDIPRGYSSFQVHKLLITTSALHWSQYDPHTPKGRSLVQIVQRWVGCQWDNMTPSTRMTTAPNLVNPLSLPQEIYPWLAITTDWPTGRDQDSRRGCNILLTCHPPAITPHQTHPALTAPLPNSKYL